jgi:YidC/Oxa1 family membrane protein insertase
MTVKMAVAQPEINKLQEKYRLRQDPQSKLQMQQETAALYKKYKINVFGCLLPLLQMPIFIAMYNVVRKITLEGGMYSNKVSNTMFLWIDLAKNVDIWNYVFAGLVGATMFLLTFISSKKPAYSKAVDNNTLKTPQAQQTEKTMKFVSYFMVIMMVVASYNSKSLAFYWIIGNLYSLGQTILSKKLNERKHKKMTNDYLGVHVIDVKEDKKQPKKK